MQQIQITVRIKLCTQKIKIVASICLCIEKFTSCWEFHYVYENKVWIISLSKTWNKLLCVIILIPSKSTIFATKNLEHQIPVNFLANLRNRNSCNSSRGNGPNLMLILDFFQTFNTFVSIYCVWMLVYDDNVSLHSFSSLLLEPTGHLVNHQRDWRFVRVSYYTNPYIDKLLVLTISLISWSIHQVCNGVLPWENLIESSSQRIDWSE